MIAKAAPSSTSSPRTTIPPPASGVFLKAYSLYAMDAEATWEPATVDLDPEEMVATDISELLGDAHDTLRPLAALLAERMGTAAREIAPAPSRTLRPAFPRTRRGLPARSPVVCREPARRPEARYPQWLEASSHDAITRHGCPRSRRRFAC